MSRAFEVMVTHVENLKRVSEKEHRELEEARKLLLDHQLQEVAAGSPPNKVGDNPAVDTGARALRPLPPWERTPPPFPPWERPPARCLCLPSGSHC